MSAAQAEIDALVSENAAMLEQFRGEGADLSGTVELDFICEFPDEETVEVGIEALKARFEAEPLPAAAKNPRFAVCTDEAESYWELMFTVDMVLDAPAISAIEHAMRQVTEKLGGEDVAWEFQDPRGNEMDQMQ